ncbi:LacI family DNA-binding transcriptional regulator [Desulfovibrio gilichinskyi]|uniref:Transcriptional regulator, LacI family n=1 Tax=Desulfovibrio gilichinskyi TaxID=1519643 RepID=A0A1X7CKA3_9BACT|nr:LacI family DNA-binding transcriptional regulator [Desulfovibrio gilichinskyi]SME98001.1 transcriptional regulator, LacI family [Desulfovibrio gilichinskyi]
MKLKDIAEAAGVSTATVSRVLGDKPNVRPELRKQVMDVVDRLNYRPNRAAQRLRSKQSSFIGLIVADIQSPFFASVTRAVEDVAQANDYSVILCNTDEDPVKERMYLEMMQSENAAGVILAPTLRLSENFTLNKFGSFPMVVIDRQISDHSVDMVLIDNNQAARDLTEHMLSHGYKRIAGLFGESSATGQQRRAGFEQVMKKNGIPADDKLVISMPAKEEAAHAVVSRLLEMDEPPEAIITSNGLLGAGAFRAIRDKELPVPESVAFASFDETPWSSMTRPAITVVKQPTYAIGQTACEMLLKRIADPERPTRKVVLESKLVVRQSCGGIL